MVKERKVPSGTSVFDLVFGIGFPLGSLCVSIWEEWERAGWNERAGIWQWEALGSSWKLLCLPYLRRADSASLLQVLLELHSGEPPLLPSSSFYFTASEQTFLSSKVWGRSGSTVVCAKLNYNLQVFSGSSFSLSTPPSSKPNKERKSNENGGKSDIPNPLPHFLM